MSDVFIFCGTFSDGKSDKDQMNTSCQYKLKKFSYFRNLLRFDEISILENICMIKTQPCKNCILISISQSPESYFSDFIQ